MSSRQPAFQRYRSANLTRMKNSARPIAHLIYSFFHLWKTTCLTPCLKPYQLAVHPSSHPMSAVYPSW